MVDKQSLLVSSKMGRKADSFANLNWSLWFSFNQGKVGFIYKSDNFKK